MSSRNCSIRSLSYNCGANYESGCCALEITLFTFLIVEIHININAADVLSKFLYSLSYNCGANYESG
jgi:hypothetical protein